MTDDLISRQSAIDAAIKADMENHNGILSEKRARVLEEHISYLPSAEPKHGKWHIKKESFVVLDICDKCMRSVRHVAPFYNFCPNCGADMMEVSE